MTGSSIEIAARYASELVDAKLKIDAQAAEIERLNKALDDAIDLAQEGISYTPQYFVEKWQMQEKCDELKDIARAALEKREVEG